MFANLKAKALEKFNQEIVAQIQAKQELITNLKPSQIKDNPIYQQLVVSPLWTLIKAQSGGSISAVQKFVDVEGKFRSAMFRLRDELVEVKDDEVRLHPDFKERAAKVLSEAMN